MNKDGLGAEKEYVFFCLFDLKFEIGEDPIIINNFVTSALLLSLFFSFSYTECPNKHGNSVTSSISSF